MLGLLACRDTGSLTCVHDHVRAYAHEGGGGVHTDNDSAQHFDSEKPSHIFSCAPNGIRTVGSLAGSYFLDRPSHRISWMHVHNVVLSFSVRECKFVNVE